MDEDSLSEEDEDSEAEASKSRPWLTLIQSFHQPEDNSAKRRKLDHAPTSSREVDIDSKASENLDDVDAVLEAEDSVAEVGDEEEDTDSEAEVNDSDPFATHFGPADAFVDSQEVLSAKSNDWVTSRELVQSLRATIQRPAGAIEAAIPRSARTLDAFHIKPRLGEIVAKRSKKVDIAQSAISPVIFNYHDTLFCDRTVANSDRIRMSTCLHALNHVLK